MSEFISDRLPVDPDLVPRPPVVGTSDGFARYAPPVLSTTPRRVAVAPGIEIRDTAITLAVEWLAKDVSADADKLFKAADAIAEYIRTGQHPAQPKKE